MTVRGKIILIAGAALFVAICANTLVNGQFFTREYALARQSELTVVAQKLKTQLDKLLMLRIPLTQMEGFEDLCADLVRDHELITYAMVHDSEGRIVYHSDRSQQGSLLTDPRMLSHLREEKTHVSLMTVDDREYYDCLIPVTDDNGQRIGSIRVGFPSEVISARTNEMVLISLKITAVFFILGIAMMFLTLNHWIARPLAGITAAIQSIANSGAQSGGQIGVKSRDEFGQLARAFNHMSCQLGETTVSKQFMDNIIESMLNSLIVLAPDQRIVSVNRATLALLGYEASEMIGRHILSILVSERGEPGAMDEAAMSELLNKGIVQYTEKQYFARDGRKIPVMFTGAVMRDAEGGVTGWVCVAQDITPLRDAEQERLKLEEQLRQAQKMQLIGTLAGGIAHNFNNLLVPIIGYASLLRDSMPQGSAEQRDLDIILDSSHRAKDLVSEILLIGRKSMGRTERVRIDDVLDGVLRILKVTIPSNIELRHDVCEPAAAIMGDASMLHQVFMNLCVNAYQAMGEGGMLTICTEIRRLQEYQPDYGPLLTGRHVAVTVQDTGCGIPPEQLPQIFDPFFTTKGPELGNGLGLATVLTMVDQQSGAIEVWSTPGQGTTFTLYFPVSMEESMQPSSNTPSEVNLLGSSILLVEDEQIVRDYFRCVLSAQKNPFDVTCVENGRDALELILADPARFDLIISDHMMPNLTGTQLLDALRERDISIPFLMVTGYNDLAVKRNRFVSDREGILSKPCPVEDLLREIARLLDHSATSV